MRKLFLVALPLAACGTSGEPINGDIAVQYGSDSPDLAVGAVIEDMDDTTKMVVQIGTNKVDCDTNLNGSLFPPKGTFVVFAVDKAAGTYDGTFIDVIHNASNHISLNGASGDVVIETIEPRVTGSLTFDTTDNDVGTITVSGSFDVVRCF